MANREINYERVLENTREIINALEYDGMRSPGKIKFNVQTLNELYALEEHLVKKLEPPKPEPKQPTKKEAK